MYNTKIVCKIKTRTYIKNLKQSSLHMNVFDKNVKFHTRVLGTE